MEEYLLKKGISRTLIIYISKNVTDQETFNVIDELINNNLTQYLIQEFIRKKLHLDVNRNIICEYLLRFKKKAEYGKLFMFGCVKIKNPHIVYKLLELFFYYKITDSKSLLKNLSDKIKNIENMTYLPEMVQSRINELMEVNFITMTKLLHNSVDILEKNNNQMNII